MIVGSIAIGFAIGACQALPVATDTAMVADFTAQDVACSYEAGARLHCVDDAGNAVHSPDCDNAKATADQCRCNLRKEFHRECDGGDHD